MDIVAARQAYREALDQWRESLFARDRAAEALKASVKTWNASVDAVQRAHEAVTAAGEAVARADVERLANKD